MYQSLDLINLCSIDPKTQIRSEVSDCIISGLDKILNSIKLTMTPYPIVHRGLDHFEEQENASIAFGLVIAAGYVDVVRSWSRKVHS